MKLHVGQGTTIGALTVFPIWHDRVPLRRTYTTDAARLAVAEVEGGPDVTRLAVSAIGELPVLVLDGQLFEGGWQHRMATRSALVPTGVPTTLDVACVERDRWQGGRGQATRGNRATTFVRDGYDRPGHQQDRQGEVWRRVDAHGGTSRTRSLVERLGDGAPGGAADQARIVLRHVRPLAGQTGVLVGVGGQPLRLEVFDHPQTLREQLGPIVRASLLDAVGRPAVATPGRRARRLVERLERTRLDHEPDVGQLARLGRASTVDLDVMSLRRQHRTLHLRAAYRRHPVLQEA